MADTLQLPGLNAVSFCEAPPIGFQMSWMTRVDEPLLPVMSAYVYGPQEPSLEVAVRAGPDPGEVDGGVLEVVPGAEEAAAGRRMGLPYRIPAEGPRHRQAQCGGQRYELPEFPVSRHLAPP
ncbi:MAG TPA: hypothetical protein VG268_15935 [Streptosporangiaceae bacterium]|nr:hypothetical protein [Streptosporangiaceae bacterium]